jgi:16S rRNA (cytidine1402-2'-O)-methyltransferase
MITKNDFSFIDKNNKSGILYLSANNIGCTADTPLRALELQKTCDLVVFEENRQARKILKQAGITRSWLKYNEHHQKDILEEIKKALICGKSVSYMSDQGCPTLADPGKELLKIAYQIKAQIKIIPGPSSLTAAISSCPFNLEKFIYKGFLSQKSNKRSQEIKEIIADKIPSIILDTPYRLKSLLTDFKNHGLKKRAFIAFDITGEEEQYHLDNISELCNLIKEKNKKNFVLIIDSE